MNHNEIKARLLQAENVEEVIAIVKENGVELSAEQAARLFEEIKARRAAEAGAEKLDEKELDAVAGGGYLPGVCKATVEIYSCTIKNHEVVEATTQSRCWNGPDYCSYWTETYEDSGVKITHP